MSKATELIEMLEKMDDDAKPKMLLRQALKHEFDKAMDHKKVTVEVLDAIKDETDSRKFEDQLDALMKVVKDKKLIALAKEQREKIMKLLKAKTVGDVRKVSPEFVADFERV